MEGNLSAEQALRRLMEGNERYVASESHMGDVGSSVRIRTAENGQHPFAAIITCSDSRVIPEAIFSAGML